MYPKETTTDVNILPDHVGKEEKIVKCWGVDCKKEFLESSREYLSIYGDICIGKYGGIIGHNFDKKGNLKRVSIYCAECFIEVMNRDWVYEEMSINRDYVYEFVFGRKKNGKII